MAETSSQAIVKWAEAQGKPAKRAPNKGAQHLAGHDVADILRWHTQGLSGEQIALKFTPPKHPTTITRCIAKFGIDNTAEAKRILRGGAASMALNIVRKGQPKDQVQALKGLGVLEEQQQQGITVMVGRGGMVNLGTVVSPPLALAAGEGEQNT